MSVDSASWNNDPSPMAEGVSRILSRMAAGDREAASDLLPAVYDELHAIAAAQFRDQREGHTLQPTALVHEAYLRIAERDDLRPASRAQFFVLASTVMRHVLVDHARRRQAEKRGGGWKRVTLSGAADADAREREIDLLALESALEKLSVLNEDDARLVELRFFGGLKEQEAADALGISRSEASRRWRSVRAWLAGELQGEAGS